MTRRISLTARLLPSGAPFRVSGQEARTLSLLVEKGQRGVTAFDFPGGPPFRLPAYCWSLIRKGLSIETRRENHSGGWHGRFVLHSAVEILPPIEARAPAP
jgi:hypothetical protein